MFVFRSIWTAAVRRRLLVAAALASLAATASAQGRGGMPGGMGRGGMGGQGGQGRGMVIPAPEYRGGLKLGPPGRWWDNKTVAKHVGVDANQQRRMDDIFTANRDTLMNLYKNLQHEESQLEKITRAKGLDENQIFQQIDRVTQARGELEKANAHYLLQIRKELTPDQSARLDEVQPQELQ
jgi:Spy/CpxP family protein refolding chaperone